MLGPTSHIYVSQRLRLHYVDWGNAQAPPLLLVHGGRDHSRSWDWVAQALRRDWHVIAPDLRGHGDSAWSLDGGYNQAAFVYDLAQLIHQEQLQPVTIVAHSLGGAISLLYTGLYPETVAKLVIVEGFGGVPPEAATRVQQPYMDRWRAWIDGRRSLAGRTPHRYPTFEAALQRMKAENAYLSDEQALHLTSHAVSRNEDGTYSWKFDPYVRSHLPVAIPEDQRTVFWAAITCPTLLAWGRDSWCGDPQESGVLRHFRNARAAAFDNAGHWLHHDQFDAFMATLRGFL
jgi:pimeloyl-ACP methyl ester carboxylesterase